ncbi:Outer membrane efflux protein [Durusdinium trenchii]|uniref:Outer membrane efflux protein n=1 Tax=Durusdinium trenchii TaxID=1381693 RepID=A0ABP0JDZ1_9DINO
MSQFPFASNRLPRRGWRARLRQCALWGMLGVQGLTAGCWWQQHDSTLAIDETPYIQAATAVEFPILDEPVESTAVVTAAPRTLNSKGEQEYWDVELEDVVHLALANSKIFRDLGGVVLRAPGSTRSTYDTAVLETDPRFGPQAALSAFDATFASSLFYEHNNRALNNVFFGGGTRVLKQEAAVFQAQISKRTPFGSEFTLRHNVDYDQNNAPGNAFPAAWDINFEAEYRQSLLRGAGIDFGRIAGASTIPGVYNGILIARANTDVSIAEFEMSVRDFLSDVENAYWDLYFAYRDLDTKIAARDAALDTWRRIQALSERGRVGGEADKEAEAREQYYRFQEEVENRRLRYLIGLPVNGAELLRPSDEPPRAEILFDWELSLQESLSERAELRRQKWMIKRRELELVASRNFLLPELDVVALYRYRGFGRTLLKTGASSEFDSAWNNLLHGNFQESQLGVELAFPFGNRQAHAAVRNAEFLLARERGLLREQEQRVVHDLSNAMAETTRAHQVMRTVYNRREAARERLKALEAAFEADKAPLNLVLDAQRRLAASESHYYATLVEYAAAVKNMHYEKGTLLEYLGVHLSEGPWPEPAYADAEDRLRRREVLDGSHVPDQGIISSGAIPASW